MSNIVEKVARIIEDNFEKDTATQAQLIVSALDIIVLPKDAEPIEGDLMYHQDFGYGEVYGFEDLEPYTLDINGDQHFLTGGDIIRRGDKIVIQE